ncbi:hypothetical protein FLONG3_3058 [Fusarium longipes]|uniref:Uncharacterized protein n=1 Tax=Fusarium longipes TaxID=694270 RepID=A0A395T383_9HYPO|nr:hypothetical protein FLONG3_3058 [Fusarium longipes]
MASFNDYPVGEESADMLSMKLNLLKGKLAQRERELVALCADIKKKLPSTVSEAEYQRQKKKRADDGHRRVRAMRREYDGIRQRLEAKQKENVDGNKGEEDWILPETSEDYFNTRWG